MEFKFNVQSELSCNIEGFTVMKVEHLIREQYENSETIVDLINKLRFLLKKVILSHKIVL
jgi:hypothetical protein